MASLPDETRILVDMIIYWKNLRCCYNRIFPIGGGAATQQYKSDPMKALFATVAVERETNPFLSCSSVVEFAALRARKIGFNASARFAFLTSEREDWRCH